VSGASGKKINPCVSNQLQRTKYFENQLKFYITINDEAKDSNDGEEDQGTCYPSTPLHNI